MTQADFGTAGTSSDRSTNGGYKPIEVDWNNRNPIPKLEIPLQLRARAAADYAVAWVSTAVELSAEKLRAATNLIARGVAELTKSQAQQNAENTREWCLGFGPIEVPPLTTVTVQAQPQCLFRVTQFLNTGDSDDLFITGAFVGQKIQLPTCTASISLKAFNNTPMGNSLKWNACDPALYITLHIQNIGKEKRVFHCTLGGKAVM